MRKIEEHDVVDYHFEDDLAYAEVGKGDDVEEFVILYNKNKPVGEITVWCDDDEDDREYITINQTIIYLDTLTKRRKLSPSEYKAL